MNSLRKLSALHKIGNQFMNSPIGNPLVTMTATTAEYSIMSSDTPGNSMSVEGIVEMVKRSLGYLEKPLVKCKHCGQWGAAYCACPSCGAPIDPE